MIYLKPTAHALTNHVSSRTDYKAASLNEPSAPNVTKTFLFRTRKSSSHNEIAAVKNHSSHLHTSEEEKYINSCLLEAFFRSDFVICLFYQIKYENTVSLFPPVFLFLSGKSRPTLLSTSFNSNYTTLQQAGLLLLLLVAQRHDPTEIHTSVLIWNSTELMNRKPRTS